MNDAEIASLVQELNESHENFVRAIVGDNGKTARIAYSNYVRLLAQVLDVINS